MVYDFGLIASSCLYANVRQPFHFQVEYSSTSNRSSVSSFWKLEDRQTEVSWLLFMSEEGVIYQYHMLYLSTIWTI